MGIERWIACFTGYVAAVISVAVAVFVFSLLSISTENGSIDSALANGNGFTIFGVELIAVAIASLPIWLVLALRSESRARRSLGFHAGTAMAGAALIIVAVLLATFDAGYYDQPGHWIDSMEVFVSALAAGAFGGFIYWLAAGRNAGGGPDL